MRRTRPGCSLVRHGQTAWSRTGRHTGRTDCRSSPKGGPQAEAVGRGSWPAHDFALVLTSPLSRAAETCRLAGFGDRAEVVDDLVEWDYGDYEGLTTDEIRQDASRAGRCGPTGCPSGETAADVGRRADRVIERARSARGDTLCFAHGHCCGCWPPAGSACRRSAAGCGAGARLDQRARLGAGDAGRRPLERATAVAVAG